MDQSKAYDIVCHYILLRKLKVIGFSNQAIKMFTCYLKDRKQFVEINGSRSDFLSTGPKSANQGSAMSGLIYTIFTLDITQIFHKLQHNPLEDRNCEATSVKTFVDDVYPIVVARRNEQINDKIVKTIKDVTEYMRVNKLAVNVPKTQVMILSKYEDIKNNFNVKIEGETINNSTQMKVLGLKLNDRLDWADTTTVGKESLLHQLRLRNFSLSKIAKYMSISMRIRMTNAIVKGKYQFGIDN